MSETIVDAICPRCGEIADYEMCFTCDGDGCDGLYQRCPDCNGDGGKDYCSFGCFDDDEADDTPFLGREVKIF